jgi:CheY-like chemotaxis protein
MPGMTGLELLRKIRLNYKKPPPVVMMVTAYGDDENRTKADEYGANDFLTKPIDFKDLKEKLNLA